MSDNSYQRKVLAAASDRAKRLADVLVSHEAELKVGDGLSEQENAAGLLALRTTIDAAQKLASHLSDALERAGNEPNWVESGAEGIRDE